MATWTGPGAAPPPPGITPNFVDPPSIGYRVTIPTIFGIALSTVFLMIRFYTRMFIVRIVGWEDVFCALAWATAVAQGAMEFVGLQYGSATHIWDVRIEWLSMLKKISAALVPLYTLSIMFSKVSILLFYRRIWPQKKFQIINWAVLAIVVAYGIALTLVEIFPCQPVKASWDASIPATFCVNVGAYSYTQVTLNIVTDLACLVIPIVMLSGGSTKIPRNERIGAGLWLSLGSLTMILAIIRIPLLGDSLKSTDPTWTPINPGITSSLEEYFGVVCATLATMRPFLRKMFPRAFPAPKSSAYNSYDDSRSFPSKTRGYAGPTAVETITDPRGEFNDKDDLEMGGIGRHAPGLDSQYHTHITGNRRSADGSEERILRDGEHQPMDEGLGITKTIDYSVT